MICLVRIVPTTSREYAYTIIGVLVPQIQESIRLLFGVISGPTAMAHVVAGARHSRVHRAAGYGGWRQVEVASTFTLCLEAFGAITNVAPRRLVYPYVEMVLEAVVLVLSHKWCTVKARITALNVLAAVVRCTGYVMTPYFQYPNLVRLRCVNSK